MRRGCGPPRTSGPERVDTISVLHEVRVMARKLKNVTVTLEPETARWARVEAARQGTSVSRMLGQMLEEKMKGEEAYRLAMDRFFAQKPGIQRRDGRRLPSREELHDRDGLR